MKRPAHRLQLPVARSRPARRVPRPGLRHVRLHCTTVARTLHTRARADRCFGRRCTRTPRSLESPQLILRFASPVGLVARCQSRVSFRKPQCSCGASTSRASSRPRVCNICATEVAANGVFEGSGVPWREKTGQETPPGVSRPHVLLHSGASGRKPIGVQIPASAPFDSLATHSQLARSWQATPACESNGVPSDAWRVTVRQQAAPSRGAPTRRTPFVRLSQISWCANSWRRCDDNRRYLWRCYFGRPRALLSCCPRMARRSQCRTSRFAFQN